MRRLLLTASAAPPLGAGPRPAGDAPAPGGIWQRVIRLGCPVCFTGDDPVLRESLSAGIGVLVGVTLVVLACFACFFVVLARRASAAAAAGAAAPVPGERALPAGLDHAQGEAH